MLVDLDLDSGVTAGQAVATIDSILTQLPDTTVRIPTHLPPRVFHHTAADPRVVTELGRRQRQRQRASLHITQHVPGVWRPERLLALTEQWRDVSGNILVIGDPRRPVATVTPSRAAGRRRRAIALAMPAMQVTQLVETTVTSATDVGLYQLTDEVDLAAHLGRW